ncbi:HAMP domain-containing sensor histidine kinase [Micromonospora sp. WMMD1128]|uniref:sensor histidine kinase n=1 Tax=Micromonospora sp. WMMD1128 TaxID=3015150 RepID=UPI00248AAB1E|nr:HAMP domain-containing sensor histidine kinase [Micromonospora sp. WMMD1128]WBB73966.1 HAMP domain-containing sensor histidine kinase [Micromonospora sp. WMMD1128]
MRRQRVPPHRSLVVRLLATSLLVAVCAILATTWLAVQSTTQAIQQAQGRSLADDKDIYDTLVGYAASHRDWSGVTAVLAERADTLERRITLMTPERQVIADSAPDGPSLRAARPSATVDPLQVDLGLTGGSARIDPRVLGPYVLTKRESAFTRTLAGQWHDCIRRDSKLGVKVVMGPTGRASVQVTGTDPRDIVSSCEPAELTRPLRSEAEPIEQLEAATRSCMRKAGAPERVAIQLDRTAIPSGDAEFDKQVDACLQKAQLAQLRPYVAPPALLFVTDEAQGTTEPVFNLSRANVIRIVEVTGAVLAATVLVTVLVGRRLVRPLRALTDATRLPADEQARVPVTTRDEIGLLATALNDLAARREQTEALRKSMVSDVAHELRTPLSNIRSWLEAAQDGLAQPDAQLLNLLLDEALLLQHIIDDLRDLAAADAGDLRIHREPHFVADLLEQVVEAHRGAAEAAGVRLATEVVADPETAVDGARLRQLVGNVVANAIRHTPAGGSVTVRCVVVDDQLTIAVSDTGTGIAPADTAKVFDRFWRADDSRTRSTGGSGLGLSIARKLAEAHDGTISVASVLGQGSTFTIRLPIVAPVPQ